MDGAPLTGTTLDVVAAETVGKPTVVVASTIEAKSHLRERIFMLFAISFSLSLSSEAMAKPALDRINRVVGVTERRPRERPAFAQRGVRR